MFDAFLSSRIVALTMFALAATLLAMWTVYGSSTAIAGFMMAGLALAIASNCVAPSSPSSGEKFKRRSVRERCCVLAAMACFALYSAMTGATGACAICYISEQTEGEKVIFLRALPLYLMISGLPLFAAFMGGRGFCFRDDPLRYVRVTGVWVSFVFAVLTAGSVLAIYLLSPGGVAAQYDGILMGVGLFGAAVFACCSAMKRR